MKDGKGEMNNGTAKEIGNMTDVAYIISNSGNINLVVDGEAHTVAPDHINYRAVVKVLKDKSYKDNVRVLLDLIDIPAAVEVASDGKVKVVDGQVLYDGMVLHNALTNRILALITDDMPFEFLVLFLENLMDNPSYRAVQELYDFLEHADLPITEDGCFLAYKKVTAEYKDIHSGKFDNSVGKVCEMPRNMVDEDKERTCSSGLHFCSLDYLPQFGSMSPDNARVVIVKINPKDVVAIPADYNNTKGRTCRYEVVSEYKGDWRKSAFSRSVYTQDGQPYDTGDHEYDEDGYDEDGYDRDGYDSSGYDADGYDRDGYDAGGYDENGYDAEGYDEEGYDEDGYNVEGIHRNVVESRDEDDAQADYQHGQDAQDDQYGQKPNGDRFYAVRGANGQFIKRS